MKHISGYNMNELFHSAMTEITDAPICDVGYKNVGGDRTKEIHPAICELKNPKNRHLIYPKRGNNPFQTLGETMWILAGRNDVEFLSKFLPRAIDFSDDGAVWRAGYGPRLFPENGKDQIEFCLNQFKKNMATRQAVATIWMPHIENNIEKTKDWPCCNWIHFLVRNGALDMTVAIRSNDIIWGWSSINVYEFTVIQEIVAACLKVKVGTFYNLSDSFHLYEKDWEKAEKMSKIDKKFVSDVDESLPSFEFSGLMGSDPIINWNTYRSNIKLMVNSLDKGDLFCCELQWLNEVFQYLNMYLNMQKLPVDYKWEAYTNFMKDKPATDLKLSIHYWAMKTWFNCKEDSGNTLLSKCLNQIKTNQLVLEPSVS